MSKIRTLKGIVVTKNGSQNAMLEQIKKLGKGVEIAEELRDQKSADNLFAGIFNGRPPFNLVFSDWPKPSPEETVRRDKVITELSDLLIKNVDPYLIDNEGSVSLEVFEALAKQGFYGMKVDPKYGGLGLSQTSYVEALSIAASWCSAIAIVLSADNTIGCKFPVVYYGTDEQKDILLPELIKWPTGFCLTEKDAGSDASKIQTYAVRNKNSFGQTIGYRISGQKWFTTNGILNDDTSLARYLAVVARIVDHPDELKDQSKKECFGLFIVPTSAEGIDIGARNTFIGMRGIHNSNPKFTNVYAPVFNLIGEKRPDWESKYGWSEREGSGLKIAFESLNTGRIAIAKSCVGVSKQALHLSRWWANKRNQLGGPLEDKELVRDKLLYAATNIMAMEAMTKYACLTFDAGQDVRLEAAAVKTFASEKSWQIVDNMMQIRGGRGYETWQSLSRRELTPPDDIIWTGSRPNRIFEGSNEIMVQFVFREGTDKFIKAAMPLMSKKSSFIKKLSALLKMTGYYMRTYDVRHIPYIENLDGETEEHLFFVEQGSRLLARKIISKSAKHQHKLVLMQLMIDRFSRIAINLGAMTLTCAYGRELGRESGGAHDYTELADVFCRAAKREVEDLFRAIDDNDDEYRYKVSKRLLNGDFDEFLQGGIIPITEKFMRGPSKADNR